MSKLLIYESEPLNAAMFARLGALDLWEVRSLSQLEKAIDSGPCPEVMAVEVTQHSIELVAALIQQAKSKSPIAVIAMPDSAVRCGERWLYEAGADLIFRSMLDRRKANTLIHNRLRLESDQQVATDAESSCERFWAGLPWKRRAVRRRYGS